MSEYPGEPRLTVVVTIVDAGAALERCLEALASQQDAPPMEILVPVDDTVEGVQPLERRFPDVVFLRLGRVPTERDPRSVSGQHELYDRRRSAGLAAARGRLVAILEDRGVPRHDWARRAVELHEGEAEVIGGAIVNARDRLLNWAVYFCDFGRYNLPLPAGPSAYVSDINVCYKRAALERTEPLWRERYHETVVHWALREAGVELRIDPSLVVAQHRDGLRLGPLLRERYGWGRLFAHTRTLSAGPAKRVLLAAACPLLPILLLGRHAAAQLARPNRARFLVALPVMTVLLAAWSAGELAGYLTARA